jgi:hypothetical protein
VFVRDGSARVVLRREDPADLEALEGIERVDGARA